MLVDVERIRLLREVIRADDPACACLLLLLVPASQAKRVRQYGILILREWKARLTPRLPRARPSSGRPARPRRARASSSCARRPC